MERARQLHDPVECDRSDDGGPHSAVQEAMLQGHSRLAHTLLADAAVSFLVSLHRVSIFTHVKLKNLTYT